MAFYRVKIVKGKKYLYKVKSKRVGDTVKQIIINYLGRVEKVQRAMRK